MDVYLGVHQPPVPQAPVGLTTYVTPWPQSEGAVREAVGTHNPTPLIRLQHSRLEFPEMPPDPVAGLEMVRQRYEHCGRCHLAETRTRVVMFRGNPYSPVVCIGEGPGKDEDVQGHPFVGRSGRWQDELFRIVGLDPDQHFGWINLVGCRPCDSRFHPDRPPALVEKLACSERTLMLLRALRPRVVLCLGKQAARAFIGDGSEKALPKPNSWVMVPNPEIPQDWVCFGYVRHPAGMLRMVPMPHNYSEFKQACLFYEALRGWMPQLQKVARWPFGFTYQQVQEAAVGGRST